MDIRMNSKQRNTKYEGAKRIRVCPGIPHYDWEILRVSITSGLHPISSGHSLPRPPTRSRRPAKSVAR